MQVLGVFEGEEQVVDVGVGGVGEMLQGLFLAGQMLQFLVVDD